MIYFDQYYRLRLFLKRHATFLMILTSILAFGFLFDYVRIGMDVPETFDNVAIVKLVVGLLYSFFGFLFTLETSILFSLIREAEFTRDFKFKNEDYYIEQAKRINFKLNITVVLSLTYYAIQYFYN